MKLSVLVPIASVFLLVGPAMAAAQEEQDVTAIADTVFSEGIGGNNQDPSIMLEEIGQRRTERESLVKVSPLQPLHDAADKWHDWLYEAAHIKLGTSVHQLFQGLSESLPGTDSWGTATDVDIIGTWELANRGEPTLGSLTMHLETRWNWGTTGPMSLGPQSLGMLQSTGNTYEAYWPAMIIRNFYWQMGSTKSKWALRLGKVTIDGILGTTKHLTPTTSCLTFACTGAFAIGLPDSGLGVIGVWHFNDRVKLLGSFHNANSNRYDLGEIGKGDFFTALDLGVKIAPKTEKAGYSHVVVWHNDGTFDGHAINGSTGKEGWGYVLLYEQELSQDGNWVSIFKLGQAFNGSSVYDRQATAALVLYDPHFISRISNDAGGIALSWVDPSAAGSRYESNVEIWYRFPLFPSLDTTLSYMAIINPALDPNNDFASAFSLRLVTAF